MTVNTNFDTLILADDGIVLGFRNRQKREISFSELDKIYIKEYKLNPLFEFAFILFPFLIILLSLQYLTLEKTILLAALIIIPVFVKRYKYKRKVLRIILKDGTVFKKKVASKFKSENIAIVNAVKREQLNYYVKVNA